MLSVGDAGSGHRDRGPPVRQAARRIAHVRLLADPANRAHELLAALGVEPSVLIADPVAEFMPDQNDPSVDGAGVLMFLRVLVKQASLLDRFFMLIARARRFFPYPPRPVLVALGREAMRQAVRLDDPSVGPVHLLVAICAIDRQLRDAGWTFKPRLAKYNRAGQLLRETGLTYPTIVERVFRSSVERRADDGRPGTETKPWDPAISADVMAIFDQATEAATRLGHGRPGTDHALSALLADHNGLCARLLKELGVNVTTLRSRLPSA